MAKRAGHIIGLGLAVATAGLAMPGGALAGFSLPAGCTAYVTVQMRSCLVSHLFHCNGDPEGYQRRIDLDQQGMTYLGIIDAEAQWIDSYSPRAASHSTLDPEPRDPASLSGLLENNSDAFDFWTTSDAFGRTRYIGEDRLTGETQTIDGVDLLQTAFRIRAFAPDGTLIWQGEGQEFVHPEWRTFLAGVRHVTDANGEGETDERPVEFAFPGESGFLASEPKFDCGVVLSGFEARP